MKLCEPSALFPSIPTPNPILDDAKRMAERATTYKAGLTSIAKRARCHVFSHHMDEKASNFCDNCTKC